MEIKKLYELLAQDNAQGVLGDKIYWNELWDCLLYTSRCV